MLLQASLTHQPGTGMGRPSPCSAGPGPAALLPLMVVLPTGSLAQVTAGPAGLCTSRPAWYSKVKGTTNSEQGSSCCSHAGFSPCWGSFVAALASLSQCEAGNLLVPLSCWCPQGGRGAMCARDRALSSHCTAHMHVPHALLSCNPAAADTARQH